MELWQAVVGSSLAILVGIGIGIFYSYFHLRHIDKVSVNFKAIFSALFRASTPSKHKTDGPNAFVTGIIRKRIQLNRVWKTIYSSVLLERHRASPGLKTKTAYSGILNLGTVRKQPELSGKLYKTIIPINKTATPVKNITPSPRDVPSLLSVENDQERLTLNQYPSNHSLSIFMDEFEQNLKTIREFAGDKLMPLRTNSWEANQKLVQRLSPELRHNLESIYADISSLNHLVWLSSEFNRSSQNMLMQYAKLSNSVAIKLNEMIAIISRSTQDEMANVSAKI
jgi:hypothetical protein